MLSQIWSGVTCRHFRKNLHLHRKGGKGRLYRDHFNFEMLESRVLLSGNILREYWTGISGTNLSDLMAATSNLTTTPNGSQYLTTLESQNQGDNYGDRIRGFVTAPQTGAYTFWVSGDDEVQLSLSNDKDPAHKRVIASVGAGNHTGLEAWYDYPSQKSAPVYLVAGQQYYIEVLHKEGGGSDSESVRWQLPDGTAEGPIPGSRISPYVPQVELYTLDDNADKGTKKNAQVQVVRSDDLGHDLTVNYTLGGNAVNGSDYALLSGTVVIPKGSKTATITITPKDTGSTTSTTAVIKLAAGANYELGTQSSLTSNINVRYSTRPAGGTSLLPSDPYGSATRHIANAGEGKIDVWTFTDQPVSQAFEISTLQPTTGVGEVAVSWATKTLAATDVCLISMWIRNTGAGDYATVDALVQTGWQKDGNGYQTAAEATFYATSQWQQVFLPFKPSIAGDYALNLRTGFKAGQKIQIGGIEMVNYGTATTVAALPQATLNYAGRGGDDDWRKSVDDQISANRKSDLTVEVRDSAGHLIPGALVTIDQTSSSFGFGSAVNSTLFDSNTNKRDAYRNKILSLFNIVVNESSLKWYAWEKNSAPGIDEVNWAITNGLKVRGHNLVWPDWDVTPATGGATSGTYGGVSWAAAPGYPAGQAEYDAHVKAAGGDTAIANQWLEDRIINHISGNTSTSKGEAVTLAGKISEWDVINEVVNNHQLTDILGDSAMLDWLRAARAADPNARLMLNDAHVLENAGMDYKHITDNYNYLKYFKDNGAPIGGFGFQSHFQDTALTAMDVVSQNLAKYDALNLSLDITEFDLTSDDQQLQADYTRDFFRMAFADPNMKNILTWGFWAGAHWAPNAAMFNLDWSTKPNGQVWQDLVLDEWRTDTTGTTSSDSSSVDSGGNKVLGTYTTRAFEGNYDITVTYNGQTTKVSSAQLKDGGSRVVVTLPGNQGPAITSPASSSASPVTGKTTVLSVQATDAHSSPDLTYTWSTTGTLPAPVTFSVNSTSASNTTTATFAKAGTYHFLVTVSDNAGLSTTSAVDVVVNQTLTDIPSMSPSNTPTVTPGATVQFTARATDQFGDTMTPTFYWSTTGTSNSINSSTGVFTAGNTAGTYRVSVANGSIHSSTLITVNPLTADGDVGAVGSAGTSSLSNGTYTLTGSGSDIWNTTDSFHYTYMQLAGDGEIIARVDSIQNTNAWSKAGIMFRNSLAANDPFVDVVLTPSSGMELEYRTAAGATAGHGTNVSGITPPHWMKLVRSGNTFTGYRSSDGSTWTQIGSISVAMGTTIYVGLAVTAHNNSLSCTATFSNVTVTPYTNLFRSGSASASSTASGSSAANAFDGNTATTWTSASSGAQWLKIDLQTVRSISRLILKWGSNYPSAFSVQTSSDNSTWTNVYSTTTGNGSLLDLAALAIVARYIRVNITAGSFGNYQIVEFSGYGA